MIGARTVEGQRLLDACEMYELGLEMLRQRFRREHPTLEQVRIEELVREWLADRPYDSPGVPVDLDRR